MLNTVTPGEALDILKESFGALRADAEPCPLDSAAGRTLARDILAGEYVPGFDRSAVDGYALRASDTFGCGEATPALLRLAGEVEMGRAPGFAVGPGECAAIPTGGYLPEGADAVAMLEYTDDYGAGLIGVRKSAAPGQGMVFKGDDVSPGAVVFRAGRRLRAMDIGALAALGLSTVPVCKRPRAAVLSTGDELVPPSASPGPGEVRDVNGPMLCALLGSLGAQPEFLGIVRDEEALLESALLDATRRFELVAVSGGSSAGARDAVARILEAALSRHSHAPGQAGHAGRAVRQARLRPAGPPCGGVFHRKAPDWGPAALDARAEPGANAPAREAGGEPARERRARALLRRQTQI